MIPTAEEFLESTELIVKFDNTQGCILEEELPELFIQFAKLHVEAALKAVWDKSEEWYNGVDIPIRVIDNDSELIVNIYPLENIK
jgi:hypothetical protein